MIASIKKVVRIEIKNGKRTETELKGEELEQWKREHGHTDTNKSVQKDAEGEI